MEPKFSKVDDGCQHRTAMRSGVSAQHHDTRIGYRHGFGWRARHVCRDSYPSRGAKLHQRLKAYLQRQGLKLNETHTRVVEANSQSFRFLEFEIRMQRRNHSGCRFTQLQPNQRVKCIVQGSAHYFHTGNCSGGVHLHACRGGDAPAAVAVAQARIGAAPL